MEVEGTQPEEEIYVKLGNEFDLFPPDQIQEIDHTLLDKVALGVWPKEFYSSFTLTSDLLPNLRLFPAAIQSGVSFNIHFIAPFNSDLGYRITGSDLSEFERLDKIKKMHEEGLVRRVYNQDSSLILTVSSRDPKSLQSKTFIPNYEKKEFEKLGILSGVEIWKFAVPYYPFKPEVLELFKRLRLQLIFPGFRFEGKLSEESLEEGGLGFGLFYPVDTGPLPVVDSSKEAIQLGEGFALQVPPDKTKLQQIKACLLLVEI